MSLDPNTSTHPADTGAQHEAEIARLLALVEKLQRDNLRLSSGLRPARAAEQPGPSRDDYATPLADDFEDDEEAEAPIAAAPFARAGATPSDLVSHEDTLHLTPNTQAEAVNANAQQHIANQTQTRNQTQNSNPNRSSAVHNPRAAPISVVAHRASITIKPPEPYKPSASVLTWISRMDRYMAQVGIVSPEDQACSISTQLSSEAYETLDNLRLSNEVWQHGERLKAQMKITFADLRTSREFLAEFIAAKQQVNENAGKFLDRVKYLASRAYEHIERAEGSEWLRDLIVQRYVDGLYLKSVKTFVLNAPTMTLDELREKTLKYEMNEDIASGKVRASKPSSSSNAAAPASAQSHSTAANSNSNSTSNSNERKQRTASQSHTASATSSNACGWCGRPGHEVSDCRVRKRQLGEPGTTNESECLRCGRKGHLAFRCFADRHVDGSPLAPNGVSKPPFNPNDSTHSSDSSESDSSQSNSSHAEVACSHSKMHPSAIDFYSRVENLSTGRLSASTVAKSTIQNSNQNSSSLTTSPNSKADVENTIADTISRAPHAVNSTLNKPSHARTSQTQSHLRATTPATAAKPQLKTQERNGQVEILTPQGQQMRVQNNRLFTPIQTSAPNAAVFERGRPRNPPARRESDTDSDAEVQPRVDSTYNEVLQCAEVQVHSFERREPIGVQLEPDLPDSDEEFVPEAEVRTRQSVKTTTPTSNKQLNSITSNNDDSGRSAKPTQPTSRATTATRPLPPSEKPTSRIEKIEEEVEIVKDDADEDDELEDAEDGEEAHAQPTVSPAEELEDAVKEFSSPVEVLPPIAHKPTLDCTPCTSSETNQPSSRSPVLRKRRRGWPHRDSLVKSNVAPKPAPTRVPVRRTKGVEPQRYGYSNTVFSFSRSPASEERTTTCKSLTMSTAAVMSKRPSPAKESTKPKRHRNASDAPKSSSSSNTNVRATQPEPAAAIASSIGTGSRPPTGRTPPNPLSKRQQRLAEQRALGVTREESQVSVALLHDSTLSDDEILNGVLSQLTSEWREDVVGQKVNRKQVTVLWFRTVARAIAAKMHLGQRMSSDGNPFIVDWGPSMTRETWGKVCAASGLPSLTPRPVRYETLDTKRQRYLAQKHPNRPP